MEESGMSPSAAGSKSFQRMSRFDRGIRRYPDRSVGSLFVEPPKGRWEERFDVYANGFFPRSRDGLSDAYELLPRLVKEKRWHALSRLYCQKHPSRSYNLADVSLQFPSFLKKAKESKELVDVAEFELLAWKIFHLFAEPMLITSERFATISEKTKFRFQTTTHLWESSHQVAKAWTKRFNKTVPRLQPASKPTQKEYSVLCRHEFRVLSLVLEPVEYKVLRGLQKGKTLGKALNDAGAPIQPEQLTKWLQIWLGHSFFSDMS